MVPCHHLTSGALKTTVALDPEVVLMAVTVPMYARDANGNVALTDRSHGCTAGTEVHVADVLSSLPPTKVVPFVQTNNDSTEVSPLPVINRVDPGSVGVDTR